MRKLMYGIILIIVSIFMMSVSVYAFENEIFKIDIPSEYEELSFGGFNTFMKSEEQGIVIYSIVSNGLKKDISTMSKSEIEELVNEMVEGDSTTSIIEHKKEKLGKSKAIKARLKSEDLYMDMYILVSDKHIVSVSFTAANETTLDSDEYKDIKKSFRMKEKTTNTTLLKLGGLAIIGVAAFFRFRKNLLR